MSNVYRASAAPAEETIHELRVSTSKGAHVVGILAGLAICFAVALVVTLVMGSEAPPEIADRTWIFYAGIAVFSAPGLFVQSKRRRTLRIVRRGESRHVVVDGAGVDLAFPLELHGTSYTDRLNGVPIYHVILQIVGASGEGRRALALHETRGAIHGEQAGWFPSDVVRGLPTERFDVGGAGTLAQVRAWIDELSSAR